MTAIRREARSGVKEAILATVRRSRVKPASRNAAKAGTRDRRTATHNRYKPTSSGGIPARTRVKQGRYDLDSMRVTRGLLLVLGIPAFFILTALSTLADTSPSPASTASGATTLPGDPEKGQTLFAQNCATCHGASLEGGIGTALIPIVTLSGVINRLYQTHSIGIITTGTN